MQLKQDKTRVTVYSRSFSFPCSLHRAIVEFSGYTEKKEKKIFLIYKETQTGSVAKSYKRKVFLICEEMDKY